MKNPLSYAMPEPATPHPSAEESAVGMHLECSPTAFSPISRRCEEIPCGYCGTIFKQKRSWQKFCCTEHRNLFFWRDKKRITVVIPPNEKPNNEKG